MASFESDPIDLTPWLARVQTRGERFRRSIGHTKLAALAVLAEGLSIGRIQREFRPKPEGKAAEQMPWLPLWPRLSANPVHEPTNFPWLAELSALAPEITGELEATYSSFAPAAYASTSPDQGWDTFYFYLRGVAVPENLRRCPATAAALAKVPHNGLHVCFSGLAPGSSLHPHTGPTNASLTVHLGLKGCSGARLHIAGRTVDYVDGRAFVLDDSYLHWVNHSGPATRYTLMVTFWHPELNELERGLLRLLVGAVR